MTKQQIKRAMEGLVEETIIPAIHDDCGVSKKEQYDFACQCIIDGLKIHRSCEFEE